MRLKAVCALSVIMLLHSIEVAESSGQLRLKLVKFRNPGSRIQNGECCDNIQWCINSCDIFIRLCLTLQSRSSSCSLVDFETPVLGGDSIDFSNSLGNGLLNPVVYFFDQWTEPIKTKVTVLDDDGQNPLGIGRASDIISASDFIISTSPDADESKAVKHGKILNGYRSELTILYQVFCDQGYFKPSCEELCVPRDNSTGHYTCDYDNSKRVCLPNWYGNDCTRYCQPRNDATGHFLCSSEGTKVCRSNWYGINCTRYCAPSDDVTGHYTCDGNGEKVCLKNWYGDSCLKYCNTKHSYICSAMGEKICTDRYYGVNCSQYCHANDHGNYRCLDNDTVTCTENYYGSNCSVHCIAKNNANGSYSCAVDGSRICNTSWYGVYCEIYCENTSASYCLQNGTKVCLEDWYGPNCDRYCIPDKFRPSRYNCDVNGNIVCKPGWFGTNCGNFTGCIDDPTNFSHYYCDRQTGAKVCHSGWAGKNCTFHFGSSSTVQPSHSISVSKYAPMFKGFASDTERQVATMISLPSSSSSSSQGYVTTSTLQMTVVVDGTLQNIDSLPISSSTPTHSSNPLTISERIHDSFATFDRHKHTSKSNLADSKAVTPQTSHIEVTPKAEATKFYGSSKTVASPLYIRVTPTIPDIKGQMTSSHLDGKANKASVGYNEISTEFLGDIPAMTPTLMKTQSMSDFFQKYTATLLSNRNSWIVPSAFSKSKETMRAHRHSERRQNFSIDNTGKEIGEESLEAPPTPISAITRNMKSAFSISNFDGESSALQHSYTSINATTRATLNRHATRPTQNSSKEKETIDKTFAENIKLTLFIGIPVLVSSLVMIIVAAKLYRSGRGRVSRSKVKAIKIEPASSTFERKRFLRSKKVEEESVSILPLIWLQLNKHREPRQSFDDLINFY